MQKINLDPFTKPITWQDIERYAPIHWTRLFAYVTELLMVFGIGYVVIDGYYGYPLLILMLTVLSVGAWLFMFRFLYNRRLRHYKVRIKKFAELNNFTYEEKTDWSGTLKSLPFGAKDLQPSTVDDKHVVSGEYAGRSFRLGLYEIVYGGNESTSTYRRAFLRFTVKQSAASKMPKPSISQIKGVDVEYKDQYLYIYTSHWNMKKMAKSIPELFATAADLLTKR